MVLHPSFLKRWTSIYQCNYELSCCTDSQIINQIFPPAPLLEFPLIHISGKKKIPVTWISNKNLYNSKLPIKHTSTHGLVVLHNKEEQDW